MRSRQQYAMHYSPKLVSFGPIHHDDTDLQLGEKYKLMWTAMYVESTEHTAQTLHTRTAENIDELKLLFDDDLFVDRLDRGYAYFDELLPWMLFVDGCSLLHIIEKAKLVDPDNTNIMDDHLGLVMQDVLLLENQLPYQLLKLLWRGEEADLINIMKSFVKFHYRLSNLSQRKPEFQDSEVALVVESPPAHLLDLQHRLILGDRNQNVPERRIEMNIHKSLITYRNMQELKASGIRMKATYTVRPTDISFSASWLVPELNLPVTVVDDTTASTFLNMIAYEMCPDFKSYSGFCSFVSFLLASTTCVDL